MSNGTIIILVLKLIIEVIELLWTRQGRTFHHSMPRGAEEKFMSLVQMKNRLK